ncbi:hypothetical protein PM082_013814 [Marasmius tenuissimus]|nr:hypothetical protein PM082_013814 [Marasmius tenuissimus]
MALLCARILWMSVDEMQHPFSEVRAPPSSLRPEHESSYGRSVTGDEPPQAKK